MPIVDRLRALAGGRLARELVWVGASRVATALVRLGGIRVLTELMEPSVFGVVGLTVGMALLASALLCAPILEATFRFYTDSVREGRLPEHRRLLGRLLRTRALWAMAALLVGGIGWAVWRGAADIGWSFVAAAVLTALETNRFFELRLMNASRHQGLHASWSLLDEVLRLACAAGAIVLLGPEPAWVIAGYALGVAAGTAVFWPFRVRGSAASPGSSGDAEWAAQRRSQVRRYALPLSGLAIVGWLTTFADRYILAAFAGTGPTGVYVAAYGLASQPFIMTALILGLSLRPVYTDAVVHGDRRRERQVFLTWLLLLTLVLTAGVGLITWLAEPLVGLLLAEGYGDAAEVLPWIAAAYAFQGIKHVFDASLYAQKRTGVLVAVELGAAIVAVGLYVALIPSYGALGAAMGTLGGMISSLVGLALLSGAVQRLRGETGRGVAG